MGIGCEITQNVIYRKLPRVGGVCLRLLEDVAVNSFVKPMLFLCLFCFSRCQLRSSCLFVFCLFSASASPRISLHPAAAGPAVDAGPDLAFGSIAAAGYKRQEQYKRAILVEKISLPRAKANTYDCLNANISPTLDQRSMRASLPIPGYF